MEPTSGQKLGRYTLTRQLGAGGMAEVWEARDDLLKRRVAVKIVRGALAESPEFSSRFLREARLAAQLQHPGIVAVFDVGLERHALFVVMPVLTGGSLSDRLARGVDDATALSWLRTLGAALDFAHGKGVVHRDVKPLNVLFDEEGSPHLSDFGLAKGLDEATHLTQTGVILGTPLYMSPEQAMGTPAGPAADQYSLGILAYRLLAGRLPYEKEPTPVLLRRTAFEEMPAPSAIRTDLPPAVDAVFARVLAKLPERRFPSCSAFVEALVPALRDRGGTPTTRLEADPPRPVPFRSGPRRVPAGLAVLGAFFSLLLATSLWIVLRPARSTAPPPVPTPATPTPSRTPTPSALPEEPPAPATALLALPSSAPAAPQTRAAAPPGTRAAAGALPPSRPTASATPTTTPLPARTPTPTSTPTPWPSPTSSPTPRPSPTAAAATPTAPRPSPPATQTPGDADPLSEVPRRKYPSRMRVKDAWVEVEKMGSHTLVFRFTDSLEGRGESIGSFGAITVPTRGDAPLLPGARLPIRLLCKGLDSSRAECRVPPPADAYALQTLRLVEGDRVTVRAVLAGFSFSATLRVED
jgi:serine/threonine-protein kinase